jgi:hypothetical protein
MSAGNTPKKLLCWCGKSAKHEKQQRIFPRVQYTPIANPEGTAQSSELGHIARTMPRASGGR